MDFLPTSYEAYNELMNDLYAPAENPDLEVYRAEARAIDAMDAYESRMDYIEWRLANPPAPMSQDDLDNFWIEDGMTGWGLDSPIGPEWVAMHIAMNNHFIFQSDGVPLTEAETECPF